METTKVALENERKIQQLQMQAISALWKKVSTLQPSTNNETNGSAPSVSNNSTAAVHDLAKTCSVLTNQVCNFRSVKFSEINVLSFRFNNCKGL